jgi:small subunit ribosomal protein S13
MRKKLYPLEKFSLKFGISLKKMYSLSQQLGANPKNLKFKLRKFQNSFVRQHFDLEFYSKFKASITKRLYFFWNIKLYRGIRHMLRLPSRGQRTHTNGKTKKKFKF